MRTQQTTCWIMLAAWLLVASGAMRAGHVLVQHRGHLPTSAHVATTSGAAAESNHPSDQHAPKTPDESPSNSGKSCKLCQLVRSLNAYTPDFHAQPILSLCPLWTVKAPVSAKPASVEPLPFGARGPPAA